MWLPVLLLAQVMLVSPPEPLPKDQPTAKRERRVKLNSTPDALFAALDKETL